MSTEPKRTHFVWDGSRLLQEYTYKGNYTYIYTDQNSYEPLAQVFLNGKDDKQYLAYFHNDQIGIPREMTDQFGNLLWYGEYTAWGRLKKDERVYKDVHQPFRLQNQYCDQETGLHYNFFRYYEPDTGRFVNQDPIRLMGGDNLYQFAPNVQIWTDALGLRAGLFKAIKNLVSKIFSRPKCNKCDDPIDVDPKDLHWSQRTAGGKGRADQLRESMKRDGYKGEPIDVVKIEGKLVTVDHTRPAVALELGISRIPARVHKASEPLPISMTGRFGSARTWGEAVAYRAGNQRPPLSPSGTPTPPKLPKPKK